MLTKSVSLNYQTCMIRPTLIGLNPDELYYYPFIVNLGRCDGGCNTVKDPFSRMWVSNEKEDINWKLSIWWKE